MEYEWTEDCPFCKGKEKQKKKDIIKCKKCGTSATRIHHNGQTILEKIK